MRGFSVQTPSARARLLLLTVTVWVAPTSFGADVTPENAAPILPSPPGMPLRQLGPGRFQLGDVALNKADRSVTFPAAVNMTNGTIEYLLVTRAGKTHESLLATGINPKHLHVAMLLLGAQGLGTNQFVDEPGRRLPGDPVIIKVAWNRNGQSHQQAAEEMVWNDQTRKPMESGWWTYVGSRVLDGVFVAEREGSIVSEIVDPDALINNSSPGRENDEIWSVNAVRVPPLDYPVEVTIQLQPTNARGRESRATEKKNQR